MKDKLRLPLFNESNWTSRRRGKIPGFERFVGKSRADFSYEDKKGVMTKYLFGHDRFAAWDGKWPTYHVDVKSTAGRTPGTPFLMRQNQFTQLG